MAIPYLTFIFLKINEVQFSIRSKNGIDQKHSRDKSTASQKLAVFLYADGMPHCFGFREC